jgi:hypothetical protein
MRRKQVPQRGTKLAFPSVESGNLYKATQSQLCIDSTLPFESRFSTPLLSECFTPVLTSLFRTPDLDSPSSCCNGALRGEPSWHPWTKTTYIHHGKPVHISDKRKLLRARVSRNSCPTCTYEDPGLLLMRSSLKTMHIQTHIIYRPNSPLKKTAL